MSLNIASCLQQVRFERLVLLLLLQTSYTDPMFCQTRRHVQADVLQMASLYTKCVEALGITHLTINTKQSTIHKPNTDTDKRSNERIHAHKQTNKPQPTNNNAQHTTNNKNNNDNDNNKQT